jgi:hypothetical protein
LPDRESSRIRIMLDPAGHPFYLFVDRSESQEALDLGVSIDGGPNLELAWVVVHHDPAHCRTPPIPEVDWCDRVDDDLLPRETHPVKLPGRLGVTPLKAIRTTPGTRARQTVIPGRQYRAPWPVARALSGPLS